MQVVVDSLLTHYQKTGSGKRAVLLIHGWGDTLQTFAALATELDKKYAVISLDLPGFGKTQAPSGVWGLDEYARFIKSFLYKINQSDLYAIVGHSNGGALAIHGLSRGVLKADKLVLLAAAGIRNQQKGKKRALKIIAKTGKAVTFWLPQTKKQQLRKKLYGVAGSDMLVTPHLQETFKKTVRQDVQADAAALTMPTLLVYGQKDSATPPLYGEIFHNLINTSTLEVINGGHFVHHDKPEQVSEIIGEFLS